MKYLIGLLFFCAGPALHAQGVNPEKLITFTNDRDSATSELLLTFYDDRYLKGMRVVNNDGGKTTETEYLISYMEIAEIPAVIHDGGQILKFQGLADIATAKGYLSFRFVSSDGQPHQCDAALSRDDQGHWLLLNQNTGKLVTEAKLTLKGQFVEWIIGICG